MTVIKWYLNLERQYGTTNKERAGTVIELVAKRGFSHAVSPNGRREVDWALADTGTDDSDYDYFRDRATRDAARTAERNGEFHNALRITTLGGRTFAVKATKVTDANAVTFEKQYQSWRRIYYSVHYMNPHCKTLFESVEQQIKDIFAGVFIELKRRGIRACIVNEATTDSNGPQGNTLGHTYDNTAPSLDRSPQHLRVVIVRDVVHSLPLDAHWTMNSTTATPAAKLIRISSEGPNHREVVYSNDIAIITAAGPTQDLTVSVHAAEVAIPNACVARHGPLGVRVDLGADPSTIPIRTALNAGQKANLTATLTGRRCAAGWVASSEHVVSAKLTSDNRESTPARDRNGTTKFWIEDRGASAYVEDPQVLLESPRAGDQLRLTLSNATVIDVHFSRVHRVNDHKLWLNLGGEPTFLADIARNTVDISLRLHGFRAKGPIEAQVDHEFDLSEFARNANKTRRKVTIKVDYHGHIDLEAELIAPTAINPLTMRIETLGVPIPIPPAAVAVPTPQQLRINLIGHPSLQPAAAAMAAGGKLTFDGKINGLHSGAGYSPKADRTFVALTTRRLSDTETDATTARRLKLAFCHELGHALGLNFDKVENHRLHAEQSNALHYKDQYGGTGSHCNYNAHLERSGAEHGRESTSSGEIYVADGGSPLCIMYHTIALTQMGDDFCPTCKAHLRRTRVRL